MIYYTTTCLCASLGSLGAIKAAVIQRIFRLALYIAVFAGCFGGLVKLYDMQTGHVVSMMPDTMVYTTFTSVVGFMLVFRSGQAYARFAEGASLMFVMQADFLDCASLLLALSRHSPASLSSILNFRRVVVRLVSCLNMLCLSELGSIDLDDDSGLYSKCIDLPGLDETTLRIIQTSSCKADTVCQLLQNAVTDALKHELMDVPAPLLTRVFQELGGGMIRFHEGLKLRNVPCPFPLLVVTEALLLIHCAYTPFQMSCVAKGPYGAAAFSAAFTFGFWTLYGLAAELDDPFGTDVNDLDLNSAQEHLNYRLLSLLSNSIAPSTTLCEHASDETHMLEILADSQSEKFDDVKVARSLFEEAGVSVPSSQSGDDFLVRSSKLLRITQPCAGQSSPSSQCAGQSSPSSQSESRLYTVDWAFDKPSTSKDNVDEGARRSEAICKSDFLVDQPTPSLASNGVEQCHASTDQITNLSDAVSRREIIEDDHRDMPLEEFCPRPMVPDSDACEQQVGFRINATPYTRTGRRSPNASIAGCV